MKLLIVRQRRAERYGVTREQGRVFSSAGSHLPYGLMPSRGQPLIFPRTTSSTDKIRLSIPALQLEPLVDEMPWPAPKVFKWVTAFVITGKNARRPHSRLNAIVNKYETLEKSSRARQHRPGSPWIWIGLIIFQCIISAGSQVAVS